VHHAIQLREIFRVVFLLDTSQKVVMKPVLKLHDARATATQTTDRSVCDRKSVLKLCYLSCMWTFVNRTGAGWGGGVFHRFDAAMTMIQNGCQKLMISQQPQSEGC
jgi:hypothetical protein